MKKKLVVLMTCAMIGTGVLSACGNNAAEAGKEPAIETAETDDASMPLLDADLRELYAGALEIYSQINFGDFDYDEAAILEKEDFTYYKITDDRFQTYDDFQKYLEQYFTKDFVKTSILSENSIMFTEDADGNLYFLGGGRGKNIYYAGHVFAPAAEQTETEISCTATAYYTNSNDPYDGDYFFTAPENPEDYTTQKFQFLLLKEDGAWKFDDFALFY